jgi:hypothetical protein
MYIYIYIYINLLNKYIDDHFLFFVVAFLRVVYSFAEEPIGDERVFETDYFLSSIFVS